MRCNALLFLFLCLGSIFPLPGQFEYGEIVGTVRDATSGVVSSAKVTLTNTETNQVRSSLTDEQGNYSFPGLRPGLYAIVAEHPGFRPSRVSNLTLRVGDRLRADVSVVVGTVNEQIEVISAAAPLLETDTSSKGQVVSGQEIRELPLNKRDYSDLLLLTSGTVAEPNHRLGGAINVNGNRALQNNYMLDGADNNSNATSYRGERVDVIRPSVDAIGEFKVQTNAYSAEFGRSAGAVVNVAIKSGTNQFHGTLWEFFRNEKLDAHGWTPTNPSDLKPKLRYNLYGANVGGPIRKDKTFFFVNYEGERERNGNTYIGSVATPELQAGNFNGIDPRAGTALREVPYDPLTGQPFPGMMIPRSRFDPVAARMLADPSFPKPNNGAPGTIGNNFNTTTTDRTRVEKFDARLDHTFSDRWRLFGRYSFSDLERFRPPIFGGLADGGSDDAFGTTATRGQNVVLGPTIMISPTTIAEVRAGFTRLGANVFPANFGSAPVTELLGIPNMPDSQAINSGWPRFSISGLSALGTHNSQPQFQIPNVFLLKGTLNFIRGAHSMKAGFDGQYIQTAVLDVSSLNGQFAFGRNVFSRNSFGDFLLGMPQQIEMGSHSVIYNRKKIYQYFFQDDYRIRPNLTLNLGVRYEYSTPYAEKFDRLTNFNPSTGQLTQAKSEGSIADRTLVHPDRNDFSPRIGFAWTPRTSWVVRGGYGIFYNHTNRQGREGLLGMNAPFVINVVRNQTASTPDPITLRGGLPNRFLTLDDPRDQIFRGNDPLLRNGYVQQWNFGVQFSLVQNWLMEVGYVGNRGLKLTRFYDINQAPMPGPPSDAQLRRPYPGFGEIQYMDSGGTSNFHSLQTRLQRQWSGGLSFLHSFTYGRGLEGVGAWGEEQSGAGRRPQNAYDFRNEYGLAGTHRKLVSVANWVYELPFGRGKRYLDNASALVNGLLGGWEWSGIWTWQSGAPLNITSSECGPNCNLGGQRRQRANLVFGVPVDLDNPTAAMWFNTDAFSEPAGPFGTVGRNTVIGPGLQNWDFSLGKRFVVTERASLQFRTEFFNAFNQVNYNRPQGNVSSSSFGIVSTALDGRNLQFALKLYW